MANNPLKPELENEPQAEPLNLGSPRPLAATSPGFQPTWSESMQMHFGEVPARFRMEQSARKLRIEEANERRAMETFIEEKNNWQLNRDYSFKRNFDLYGDMLRREPDINKRIELAGTLGKGLLPRHAEILNNFAKNVAQYSANNALMGRLIQQGKIEPPKTAEDAERLYTSKWFTDAANVEGEHLMDIIVPLSQNVIGPNGPEKPYDFTNKTQEETAKQLRIGLAKARAAGMFQNPDGTKNDPGPFLDQWLETPGGQRRLIAHGVQSRTLVEAEAMAEAKSMDTRSKEQGKYLRSLREKINKMSAGPERDAAEAEYKKLAFTAGQSQLSTKTLAGFIMSETAGTPYASQTMEELFAKNPEKAHELGRRFFYEMPVTVAGGKAQTAKDIVQREEAENKLLEIAAIKNNVETLHSYVDRIIKPGDEGLMHYLKGKTMSFEAFASQNPDYGTYVDMRKAFMNTAARVLGGEKGVLTNQDLERWVSTTANPWDSYRTKVAKRKVFSNFMNFAVQLQEKVANGQLSVAAARKRIEAKRDLLLDMSGVPESPAPPSAPTSDAPKKGVGGLIDRMRGKKKVQ